MDKEKCEYISEGLSKIGAKTIDEVLKIADETGEDRDELARAFVKVMHDMVCSNTFSGYEFK